MKKAKMLLSVLCGLAILCAMVLTGCGGDGEGDAPPLPPPPPAKAISLERFDSCSEVETFVKDALIKTADEQLDRQMAETCRSAYVMDVNVATGGSEGDDGTSPTFTGTNAQEAGVDEADIVKTNGDHTLVLSDNRLHIVKTWPVSKLAKASSVDIEGTPVSMYLVNDRAVVFSRIFKNVSAPAQTAKAVTAGGMGFMYGSWNSSNSDTKLTFIDVSNKAAPKVTRESYYRGSFNTARRIGDEIYVVVSPQLKAPEMDYTIDDYKLYPECGADGRPKSPPSSELKAAVAKVKEKNRTNIASWNVTSGSKLQDSTIGCGDISRSRLASGTTMTGITRVRADGTESEDKSEFVMSGSGTVYANLSSIYVTSPKDDADATIIHRFALETQDDGPLYFGSTEAEGWVLNQFSMSEFEGHLRVVTTAGHANKAGETVESMVSIIDAGDQKLPVVGKAGNIGAGEEVKSVRFIGGRGYVVTFKKIDPLFVMDLVDPKNPVVAGELKVPGFSTYLHPLERDHLIGLGKDADDQGGFAWFQGLKLSMFDVTDSANPAEDANVVIGARGTMSPAFESHLAFTFDADKKLLALPLTLCEAGQKGYSGSQQGKFSYDGVQVYQVGAKDGFKMIGEIKVSTDTGDGKGYYNNKCNGWSYAGDVLRAILIGDDETTHVLIVTKNGVKLSSTDGSSMTGVDWSSF